MHFLNNWCTICVEIICSLEQRFPSAFTEFILISWKKQISYFHTFRSEWEINFWKIQIRRDSSSEKFCSFPLNVTVILPPTRRHISDNNYRQINLVLLRFCMFYGVWWHQEFMTHARHSYYSRSIQLQWNKYLLKKDKINVITNIPQTLSWCYWT